ncbi:MAG: chloramphenicol acetyltransferase [Rhodobacteraceae bacterium]|nr:chloramphenicol acetyltransferase [Paracoccaceae bacterium]
MTKGLNADGPLIHPGCKIGNSDFGPWTEVGEDSVILNSTFGAYSYCTRLCDIANTTVGKFANIASMVRIGPTDHPMTRASLHHFLYRSAEYWPDEAPDADFFAARAARRTVIGHDTWIGHGAVVKPEVTVGNGAVIGSGSVVTKDVPAYTIAAGNPAKVIRRRFPEEVGQAMDRLAWWDWDHETLRKALPDFRALPAEAFLAKYG